MTDYEQLGEWHGLEEADAPNAYIESYVIAYSARVQERAQEVAP